MDVAIFVFRNLTNEKTRKGKQRSSQVAVGHLENKTACIAEG